MTMEVEEPIHPETLGASFMDVEPPPSEQTPSEPHVEMLGTPENGMAVVYPSSSDAELVNILRQIHELLQKRSVHRDLDKFLLNNKGKSNKKKESIRRIQGDRIEIFVEADQKSSACFDQVLGKRLPRGAKKLILEYARRQANQDPRQKNEYDYGNFSLIVNFSKCQAQAPHIDLVEPNYQFGLVLSEGSPGTLFFESEKHIQTVDALAQHWKEMAKDDENNDVINNNNNNNNNNDGEMPPKLVAAIREDEGVKMLLASFGDVLDSERYMLSKMKSKNQIPTGSLLSLPGGVVHAGPVSTDLRAVIFFSGWKRGSEVAAYDPDVQYTGAMLAGHFTSILWRRDGMEYPDRLFLLRRLVQYIEGSTVKKVWAHFSAGELANFVANIEEKNYLKKLTKEEYIQHMARNMNISVPGDEMSEPVPIDITTFERLSVNNLFTLWPDEKDPQCEIEVILYRRKADGKLILRYPTEGEECADEYEGHRDGENFRLTMHRPNSKAKFNGTNGTLLDTDGEVIKIYKGRQRG